MGSTWRWLAATAVLTGCVSAPPPMGLRPVAGPEAPPSPEDLRRPGGPLDLRPPDRSADAADGGPHVWPMSQEASPTENVMPGAINPR